MRFKSNYDFTFRTLDTRATNVLALVVKFDSRIEHNILFSSLEFSSFDFRTG